MQGLPGPRVVCAPQPTPQRDLCVLSAPGVQHLWALPGGALLWLPVPAEGLARAQEALSGEEAPLPARARAGAMTDDRAAEPPQARDAAVSGSPRGGVDQADGWTRATGGAAQPRPRATGPAPAPPPRSPGAGAETAGRLRRDSSHYLYVNMFVNSCTVFLGGGRGRVRNYK